MFLLFLSMSMSGAAAELQPGRVFNLPSASECLPSDTRHIQAAKASTQVYCLCWKQWREEQQQFLDCSHDQAHSYLKKRCSRGCQRNKKPPHFGLFNGADGLKPPFMILTLLMLTRALLSFSKKEWMMAALLVTAVTRVSSRVLPDSGDVNGWVRNESSLFTSKELDKPANLRNVFDVMKKVLRSMVKGMTPHLVAPSVDQSVKKHNYSIERHQTLITDIQRYARVQEEYIMQLQNQTRWLKSAVRDHEGHIERHASRLDDQDVRVIKITRNIQEMLAGVGVPGDLIIYISIAMLILLAILGVGFLGRLATIHNRQNYLFGVAYRYHCTSCMCHDIILKLIVILIMHAQWWGKIITLVLLS